MLSWDDYNDAAQDGSPDVTTALQSPVADDLLTAERERVPIQGADVGTRADAARPIPAKIFDGVETSSLLNERAAFAPTQAQTELATQDAPPTAAAGDTRVTVDQKRMINCRADLNQLVPFKYDWAWQKYLDGCANHWMPQEINMTADIAIWKSEDGLTDDEKQRIRDRIDEGVARIADGEDPALLDEPLAMLRSDRSTRETVELANAWSRDAIAALDPIPDGPVREALTRFAQAVADRSS